MDKVQFGAPIAVHHKNTKERVRLLDTRIHHFLEDFRVLGEVHEKFLLLLHVAVCVRVHQVRVVEKQVVLGGQLDLDVLDLAPVLTTLEEDFDANRFEGANLFQFVLVVLNLELQRRFPIVQANESPS